MDIPLLYPAVDEGSQFLLRRHCTLGTEYEGLATTGPEPNTSRTKPSFMHLSVAASLYAHRLKLLHLQAPRQSTKPEPQIGYVF